MLGSKLSRTMITKIMSKDEEDDDNSEAEPFSLYSSYPYPLMGVGDDSDDSDSLNGSSFDEDVESMNAANTIRKMSQRVSPLLPTFSSAPPPPRCLPGRGPLETSSAFTEVFSGVSIFGKKFEKGLSRRLSEGRSKDEIEAGEAIIGLSMWSSPPSTSKRPKSPGDALLFEKFQMQSSLLGAAPLGPLVSSFQVL